MVSMAFNDDFSLNPRQDDNNGRKTWVFEAEQLICSLKIYFGSVQMNFRCFSAVQSHHQLLRVAQKLTLKVNFIYCMSSKKTHG